MKKHNLAFIDIEATGPDVIKHEIIEIGCVLTTPELKINQYNPEEWTSACTLRQTMEILSKKLKDFIMVGQNVAFDSGFLEHAFSKTGVVNTMHYHKLDTISIAWAKLHRSPDL